MNKGRQTCDSSKLTYNYIHDPLRVVCFSVFHHQINKVEKFLWLSSLFKISYNKFQ